MVFYNHLSLPITNQKVLSHNIKMHFLHEDLNNETMNIRVLISLMFMNETKVDESTLKET